MPFDKELSLLEQELEEENMQQAAALLKSGVQLIPYHLLQPVHDAIEAMLNDFNTDEKKRVILDFYLDHFQY
ncbi:MAG: hypothetical protein ACR2JB_30225 [Bryobacteraceae bacterium]